MKERHGCLMQLTMLIGPLKRACSRDEAMSHSHAHMEYLQNILQNMKYEPLAIPTQPSTTNKQIEMPCVERSTCKQLVCLICVKINESCPIFLSFVCLNMAWGPTTTYPGNICNIALSVFCPFRFKQRHI